jgi:hypothetical protein
MTAVGVCGSCGADLGDGALRLALEAGPGPRGTQFTSVTGTRLDRFDVCAVCLAGEGAASTVLAKMLDDRFTRALAPPARRCRVACMRPRHRTRVLLGRRRVDEFEDAHCPVCFGPADVVAAPGAQSVRTRWRDRVRNRVPLRDPWNVKEISE